MKGTETESVDADEGRERMSNKDGGEQQQMKQRTQSGLFFSLSLLALADTDVLFVLNEHYCVLVCLCVCVCVCVCVFVLQCDCFWNQ